MSNPQPGGPGGSVLGATTYLTITQQTYGGSNSLRHPSTQGVWYNTSIAQYKDMILRQNTWKQISTTMEEDSMTCEDWRKVWKQKTDAFMKAKEKEIINSPSGCAAKMISNIPLYDQLSFLVGHKYKAERSTESNLDELEELSNSGGQTCASQDLTDDFNSSNEQRTSRSVALDDKLDEAEDNNTPQDAIRPSQRPNPKRKAKDAREKAPLRWIHLFRSYVSNPDEIWTQYPQLLQNTQLRRRRMPMCLFFWLKE